MDLPSTSRWIFWCKNMCHAANQWPYFNVFVLDVHAAGIAFVHLLSQFASYARPWVFKCGWAGLKVRFWWPTCFWENPTFWSETRFAPHLTISKRLAPFSIEFEQKSLCDLIEKKLNRFHENAHSFWLNCFHKILKIALKSSCWHWPRTTANSKLISWEQNPLLTLFTHTCERQFWGEATRFSVAEGPVRECFVYSRQY